jgi:SAM-dependent methyltransferase
MYSALPATEQWFGADANAPICRTITFTEVFARGPLHQLTLPSLRRLYELPPKEIIRKTLRLFRRGSRAALYIDDILASPKHIRPQRPYDMLSRYEAIIRRHHPWPPLEFEDRSVLEIGAGPLLGFAPLAVFLGCARYLCVEPGYSPEILESHAIVERYFLPLHKDLSALYGERLAFEEYLTRLRDLVRVERVDFLHAPIDGSFEIAISNSCLEHIFPLDESIQRLASVLNPEARFIHLIDFGSHRVGRSPFNGMYSCNPDSYFAKYGKKVNLLRGPDVLRIFHDAGLGAALVPYYRFDEFYDEDIAPYWTERYTKDELFLKAAIIAGPVHV